MKETINIGGKIMLLPIIFLNKNVEGKNVRCIQLRTKSGKVYYKPLEELNPDEFLPSNELITMALQSPLPEDVAIDCSEEYDTESLCKSQQKALQKLLAR